MRKIKKLTVFLAHKFELKTCIQILPVTGRSMTLGKLLDLILHSFVSEALYILESRAWGDGLVASQACEPELHHQSQCEKSWCAGAHLLSQHWRGGDWQAPGSSKELQDNVQPCCKKEKWIVLEECCSRLSSGFCMGKHT